MSRLLRLAPPLTIFCLLLLVVSWYRSLIPYRDLYRLMTTEDAIVFVKFEVIRGESHYLLTDKESLLYLRERFRLLEMAQSQSATTYQWQAMLSTGSVVSGTISIPEKGNQFLLSYPDGDNWELVWATLKTTPSMPSRLVTLIEKTRSDETR